MKMPWGKSTDRSQPLKGPSNGLSEEQLSQIVETVTTALESKLRAQNNYFLEENIRTINQRMEAWMRQASNDLFTLRRYLTDSTEKMQAQIDQVLELVEEMTTGKGEPNRDLLELARRVQDLEGICENLSTKVSALQLKNSGASSKR